MPKKCEHRCYFCKKRWEAEHDDPPRWGVVMTICSFCYTKLMEEFERQFPRVLSFPKKRLRVEGDGR